jgi:hypothetical protein
MLLERLNIASDAANTLQDAMEAESGINDARDKMTLMGKLKKPLFWN